jgi:hypothetical protein
MRMAMQLENCASLIWATEKAQPSGWAQTFGVAREAYAFGINTVSIT